MSLADMVLLAAVLIRYFGLVIVLGMLLVRDGVDGLVFVGEGCSIVQWGGCEDFPSHELSLVPVGRDFPSQWS